MEGREEEVHLRGLSSFFKDLCPLPSIPASESPLPLAVTNFWLPDSGNPGFSGPVPNIGPEEQDLEEEVPTHPQDLDPQHGAGRLELERGPICFSC